MTDPSRAEYPPTVPMRIAAPTETINLFVDDSLQQELEDRRHDSHRLRTLTGLGMLAAAGGITAAVAWGSSSDEKVTYDVPYSTTAQETVEAVDTALAAAGSVLLPASVATIAAAKIAGRYSPAIRSADKASSMELTDDGKKKVGASRQALRTVAAGGVPVIASGAVMMSSLMSGIGQEITTGPSRPIENMFDGFPTDGPRSIVVQEDASEPMLQSHITRQLAGNIQQVAAERGVLASPVDLYLTSATYNGDTLSSLVIGTEQIPGAASTPETPAQGCDTIPVGVDETANIPVGSEIEIAGYAATVVEETTGTSAINRIGITASREAIAACFSKNPEAPDYGVIIGADQETAAEIVAEANADLGEVASTISDEKFMQNSEDFWRANVKPVTNVTALLAGATSFLAMGSLMGARLLRNRREWATKLAQGVSSNQLRATELLRAAKDGVVASAIGITASVGLAPLVNGLESGLKVGTDFKSAMVGSAVGIIGSIGGTLHHVIKPRKTVDPSEHTRI